MNYVINKLLKETIWFLEKCQKMTFNEGIDVASYWSLTNCKFNFINNLLKNEEDAVLISKKMRIKLNRLIYKDNYIYSSVRKAVSK